MGWWITLLISSLCVTGHTDELFRPQNQEEIQTLYKSGVQTDYFVRVVGAELAWADYAALRRDFPELRPLQDSQIHDWILDNFAYVSETQLGLNGVRHTDIPVDRNIRKPGVRPPSWNRAAVLDASTGGLIDEKGVGYPEQMKGQLDYQRSQFEQSGGDPQKLNALRTQDHNDGVMSLGEVIAEVTRQRAAQKLFDLFNASNGTNYQTVESYFVIALPSDILKKDNEHIPMGIYGRQAHFGRGWGNNTPDSLFIDPYGGKQKTYSGASVDYGGVIIKDPRLQGNYGIPDNSGDAQHSNPWAWGHKVARAFRDGDKDAVWRHVDREMMAPIDGEWSALPVAQERARYYQVLPSISRAEWEAENVLEEMRVQSPTEVTPVIDDAVQRIAKSGNKSAIDRLVSAGKLKISCGVAATLMTP